MLGCILLGVWASTCLVSCNLYSLDVPASQVCTSQKKSVHTRMSAAYLAPSLDD